MWVNMRPLLPKNLCLEGLGLGCLQKRKEGAGYAKHQRKATIESQIMRGYAPNAHNTR